MSITPLEKRIVAAFAVPNPAIAIAILSALPARVGGQEARVFDGTPPANWIAPAKVPGDSFTVFHARKPFALETAPSRFVVHVSADNRYRLYVDGLQVSSRPQRSDVTHWRYETGDLAPQLRPRRHVNA